MSFAALTHDCLLIVQTAIETAGTTDDIAAVRDAMPTPAWSMTASPAPSPSTRPGTPTKGGAIIEYYVDDATGTVSQRLETPISADELT